MSDPSTFGARIRCLRLLRDWTMQDAADRLGLGKQTVYNDERRRKPAPPPEIVTRYAVLYGVSEEWLRSGGLSETPSVEQVAWVFQHLYDQFREGGTFRRLIYDRMGFGPEAYSVLYVAGGMLLSNMLSEAHDVDFGETQEKEGETISDAVNSIRETRPPPADPLCAATGAASVGATAQAKTDR